jgi:hypothetical protein
VGFSDPSVPPSIASAGLSNRSVASNAAHVAARTPSALFATIEVRPTRQLIVHAERPESAQGSALVVSACTLPGATATG